jgi:uncharacterized membrane protein
MTDDIVHAKTLCGSLALFIVFLAFAIALGIDLPDRYPTRFDSSGSPTQWSEGPGSWILLAAVGAFCFGQGFLLQRFVLTDPDSTLLNLPQKEQFQRLPRERKIPIVRRVNRMLGVMNILTLLLFFGILLSVYLAALSPDASEWALGKLWIWAMIGGVVLLPAVEIVGVRRMILTALSEEGLNG